MFTELKSIIGSDGKPIKEKVFSNRSKVFSLTLRDFLFKEDEFVKNPNGVYVFTNNDKVLYVGKTSSRAFIERIAGHFDARSSAWFHSFLKSFLKSEGLKNKVEQGLDNSEVIKNYEDAARKFLLKDSDLQITMITIKYPCCESELFYVGDNSSVIKAEYSDLCKAVEKYFKMHIEPEYNSYAESNGDRKHIREISLKDYLSEKGINHELI